MITAFVKGQDLKLTYPVIASDSINYLELNTVFQTSDWKELDEIYAIFQKEGESVYEIKLINGKITRDMGLNLTTGTYKVHFIGATMTDGIPTPRITTIQADLVVMKSGMLNGEPFPSITPTERDRLLKYIKAVDERTLIVTSTVEYDDNGQEKITASHSSTEILEHIKNGGFSYGFLFQDNNFLVGYFSIGLFDEENPIACYVCPEFGAILIDKNKEIIFTEVGNTSGGEVKTVNNISPDSRGNVYISYEDVGAASKEEFDGLKSLVTTANTLLQNTLEGVE